MDVREVRLQRIPPFCPVRAPWDSTKEFFFVIYVILDLDTPLSLDIEAVTEPKVLINARRLGWTKIIGVLLLGFHITRATRSLSRPTSLIPLSSLHG